MTTLFISGIDTDIGKSYACGALANSLLKRNHHVFTQKWVETGCDSHSKDLATHQKLVGSAFNTASYDLHSPYRFYYPASPHLAADLAQIKIDPDNLIAQTAELESMCEHLIIEGAGGLCVPLNQDVLMVDLITKLKLPILLVTSVRLGSINHTILALELCQQRGIEVRGMIYNHFPAEDPAIFADTRQYLKTRLSNQHKQALWLELLIENNEIDLSEKQMTQLLA